MKVYLDNCCYNRPYDDNSSGAQKTIKQENFDYTKWHKEYFSKDETLESFLQKTSDYAELNKKINEYF